MKNLYYAGAKEGFVFYIIGANTYLVRCGTPSVEMMDELCKKRGGFRKRIWDRDVQDENRHYLETGIWGSYETAGIHDFNVAGEEIACFDDTEIIANPDGLCFERKMIVGGKRFKVESVFGNTSEDTPTTKLMSAIDTETNSS